MLKWGKKVLFCSIVVEEGKGFSFIVLVGRAFQGSCLLWTLGREALSVGVFSPI